MLHLARPFLNTLHEKSMRAMASCWSPGRVTAFKDMLPVVARRGEADDRRCHSVIAPTLLINQKSKLLTVANIKRLLLVSPVPRGFFLLSILIYCSRSRGASSLIMKRSRILTSHARHGSSKCSLSNIHSSKTQP